MKSILTVNKKDEKSNIKIFFGENSGIQRYDFFKYEKVKQLEELQRNAFWNPNEITMTQDKIYELPEWVRKIFISNLLYQTVMDSVQNRGLDSALLPYVTSPEWEALFKAQAYFELIHSISYGHNIRNVFPDPTATYDEIAENKFIQSRIKDEVDIYDKLMALERIKDEEEKKKLILEACIRINALEGLKFYVSFLYTYQIEVQFGVIPGSAKIIKLINFDEDLHLAIFQYLLKILRTEESEGFTHLFKVQEGEDKSWFEKTAIKIYRKIYKDELEWAEYLGSFYTKTDKKTGKEEVFNLKETPIERSNDYEIQEHTLPGMTSEVVNEFVKYYVNDRLRNIGIKDPLFESNKENDVVKFFKEHKNLNQQRSALQETDAVAYAIGMLKEDVTDYTEFKHLL